MSNKLLFEFFGRLDRRQRIVRSTGLSRGAPLALLVVCLTSCASVSTSDTHPYPLGDSELQLSARAERGFSADHLFIVINGVDVADAPFGYAQAAGTILRGTFNEISVEAHCGHRWRPGIHIGYRCLVNIGRSDPIEVDF